MAGEGTGDSTEVSNIEMTVREELRGRFDGDLQINCYGQGDALDVHVEFEDLDETLSDALDGLNVQQYSSLRFTVPRR